MYIVSSCLMGNNCKYNGGNNLNSCVKEFLKDKKYVEVCPEVAGGLPTPRPASEFAPDGSGKIINTEGKDVTVHFVMGSIMEFSKAMEESIIDDEALEGAILKAKSPSCGKGKIYDGTFSGTLKEGNGCFAAKLIEAGIPVITEKELEKKENGR